MLRSRKHATIRKSLLKEEEKWPQDGDVYFWVRSDIGMVCHSEWADDGPYHQFRKDTGNCFRTRADARNAIEEVKSFNRWKGDIK